MIYHAIINYHKFWLETHTRGRENKWAAQTWYCLLQREQGQDQGAEALSAQQFYYF